MGINKKYYSVKQSRKLLAQAQKGKFPDELVHSLTESERSKVSEIRSISFPFVSYLQLLGGWIIIAYSAVLNVSLGYLINAGYIGMLALLSSDVQKLWFLNKVDKYENYREAPRFFFWMIFFGGLISAFAFVKVVSVKNVEGTHKAEEIELKKKQYHLTLASLQNEVEDERNNTASLQDIENASKKVMLANEAVQRYLNKHYWSKGRKVYYRTRLKTGNTYCANTKTKFRNSKCGTYNSLVARFSLAEAKLAELKSRQFTGESQTRLTAFLSKEHSFMNAEESSQGSSHKQVGLITAIFIAIIIEVVGFLSITSNREAKSIIVGYKKALLDRQHYFNKLVSNELSKSSRLDFFDNGHMVFLLQRYVVGDPENGHLSNDSLYHMIAHPSIKQKFDDIFALKEYLISQGFIVHRSRYSIRIADNYLDKKDGDSTKVDSYKPKKV